MGGGGDSGGTSTSVTQNFSPEESARRTMVQDEARRIYDSYGNLLTQSGYPGARPIGPTPASQLARSMMQSYALGPALDQTNAISDAVQFGLSDVLYPSTNPALAANMRLVNQEIAQQYMDPGGVMSSIRTGAQDAQPGGGSRQGIAEGVAAGRALDAMARASTQMANQGYQAGLDTFRGTLAFAPQAMQTATMPMTMLDAVGAIEQGEQQALEDYAAQQRWWAVNAPWMPLQNYANIVFGGSTPTTRTSTNYDGGGGNNMMQGLGAALQLISLFAGL